MVKKVLACLLTAAMSLSVMAACSNTSGSPESSSVGSSANSAGGEQVVLTALVNTDNPMTRDPDTMNSFTNLEKQQNVDIQWEVVRTGWGDKKNLMLASSDMPDMFFGNRTLSMSDIVANEALFVDLSSYIEKFKNIKTMFEETPATKALVDTGNGIYCLPAKMPLRPQSLVVMFINKTWLDKVNLPVPSTTEELYTALKAFKEKDPNGNGQADEIPWCANNGQYFSGLWSILGAFGVPCDTNYNLIVNEDDTLSYGPAMDGFKDAVKYLNRLYKEGLIDQEAFIQDGSQYNAKMYSSDPQMAGMGSSWTIASGVGEANKKDFVVLPALEGPNGQKGWSSQPVALSVIQCSWALTKSCKNPDVAFDFVDAMYEPETSVQFYFGSYGETLEKTDDGKIKILDPEDPSVTFNDKVWEVGFGDMGPYYVTKEVESRIIPNSWVTDRLDQEKAYTPYYQKKVFPPMLFSNDDSNELSVLKTDIDTIVNQKFAAWITGEADVDAEWEDYKKSLDGVGLPRMMEIYTKYWKNSNQ